MRTLRLVDAHTGRSREIRLERESAALDGRAVSVLLPAGDGSPREIAVDGRRYRIAIARAGDRTWVWCEGAVHEFETARRVRTAAAEHAVGLAAPMPGRVRRLVALEGAAVARGEVLLVLEAMKMEHAIRAPHDGVLERFRVREGDLVEAGMELAELAQAGAIAPG